MVISVAEGKVDHGETFEVMAHDMFVDDTHAAMQLHRLLTHQSARLSDIGFGCSNGALPLRRIVRVRADRGDDRH